MDDTIGKRIREQRIAAQIKQEVLAARIGACRSVLSRIECDVREATFKEVCDIAKVLGVPLEEFIPNSNQV